MAEEWTDAELTASVDAYREMARLDAAQKPYSKKDVYRDLAERFDRTEGAFEYRMQNISAVLNELGEPWLPGLKPAANVGANVKARLATLLQRQTKNKRLPVSAAYKAKLPAMRDWLIQVARSGKKVTYGDVMSVFAIDRFSLRHAMDILGHQAENLDEPIITALIVSSKKSGTCSPGLAKEFGVTDDEAEQQKLYSYWALAEPPAAASEPDASLAVRAARFASVEARPEQAAFRRLVFEACEGRCVISGCNVGRALDAAHLHGRDWRKGHNKASDGILLRKDLHALYDARMLRIGETQLIECDLDHYRQFHGAAAERPRG